MHLYGLTLQKASDVVCAIHGNFSGTKQQLILTARGQSLELFRPDPSTGKLASLLSVELFGVIRSLASFRLTGGSKDYIVVGSDSGRICILEYLPEKNIFDKVHQETFGKSGCRRIVPGQYLAADPKGRALMIGAPEKQKLVYIMNRDSTARLTISSPLEAHKPFTVVFDIVGMDVGFENPLFACLECDYEEVEQDTTGEAARNVKQHLTIYELDLGLNHVVRKETTPLDLFANKMFPVPGGNDGPGGVLLCHEGFISYHNTDSHSIIVPIPRRKLAEGAKERVPLITAGSMHKTKSIMIFLLQTDDGDLFRLTLPVEDEKVQGLILKYFDTVPVANSLCLLKSGFLFVAAEAGNHHLFQIAKLGDNDDEPEYTSEEQEPSEFVPRGLLNLVPVDQLESLCPLISCQVGNLANEDTPQIYAACGRGSKSSLRVLRHGLKVGELAVSPMPSRPTGVWTLRQSANDPYDSYIVVSFSSATLVLSVGETVEEVSDSGFLATTHTLAAHRMGDDALIQVYPEGIRHIRGDKRINEWKAPAKRAITHCALNHKQLAITLLGGELVYFEMDATGQLHEYSQRLDLPGEVTCMAVAPIAEGQQRARFLAIGFADNYVRLVSLDIHDCLERLTMQAAQARPASLVFSKVGEEGDERQLYMFAGLENGVLLRSTLDVVSGELTDLRTRYLGPRAVALQRLDLQGHHAVLALSSRPWLSYTYQGYARVTPLSYEALDSASSFCSEQCADGIVAVSKNTMRVLSLDHLGSVLHHVATPLPLTPRKFILDPPTASVILIETDHNAIDFNPEEVPMAKNEDGEEEEEAPAINPLIQFGNPRPGAGVWSSHIRVLDPLQSETFELIKLQDNEAAIGITLVQFQNSGDTRFVLVGVVRDWVLQPKSFRECSIHTYRYTDEKKLEFVHKTIVEDIPQALVPFQGRVLVGVGRLLRIYDMGKLKLLRKCEAKSIPSQIVDLQTMGSRIYVSDAHNSIFFLKYKDADNKLIVFADDSIPKWMVHAQLLDYHTVVGSDKFGSIFVLRLPEKATDDIAEDPSGVRAVWDKGGLHGAATKVENIATYFAGDPVLSIQCAALNPNGYECILYATITGTLGILLPFSNREDIEFYQTLQMHLRQEATSLCGRDHLAFRSYYAPVKNVVDGDLCEQFNVLDASKKKDISENFERPPIEITKKLEDLRNKFAF